jgi:tetratricopeptide (TPR) repeat protein
MIVAALVGVRPHHTIALQQVAGDWSQLTARLEKAALDGAANDLKAIRLDLAQRIAAPGADEAALRYADAYAAYRLVNLPGVTDREKASLLDDAVAQLQAALKRNPKDAEAHALLGSVYGLQIAAAPLVRGMTLGPRANAALDRASEIDATNARVLLVQGVSAFNTPAMFGGGTDKAEQFLRRSLDRFAGEPASKPWPNWGRFDAHVWLGQVLLYKGNRSGARAEYDQARALAPNSGWLRYVLLPELDARK